MSQFEPNDDVSVPAPEAFTYDEQKHDDAAHAAWATHPTVIPTDAGIAQALGEPDADDDYSYPEDDDEAEVYADEHVYEAEEEPEPDDSTFVDTDVPPNVYAFQIADIYAACRGEDTTTIQVCDSTSVIRNWLLANGYTENSQVYDYDIAGYVSVKEFLGKFGLWYCDYVQPTNALIEAIEFNDTKGAIRAMRENPEFITTYDAASRSTPLMLALKQGNAAIVDAIMRRHPNRWLLHHVNKYGNNALIMAALSKLEEQGKRLVCEGINVHRVNYVGQSAGYFANKYGLDELATAIALTPV